MRSNHPTKFLLYFAVLLLFVVLAFIADHFLLAHLVSSTTRQGLLFPPGAEFPYQTPEFSHKAKINSLGFRDREWKIQKNKATTRILAIGDSFTFGMGVDLDQTWPKVLEQRLRTIGLDVEVANLGRPGAAPDSYAKVAQKAIPLLNPDIILVAILQGDDLGQTIQQIQAEQNQQMNSLSDKMELHIKRAVQYLFPNSFHILRRYLTNESTFKSKERLLESIWKHQAEKLVASYTAQKKARFDRMGDTARDMFLRGYLNPGIVNMAISDPQYFATPLETETPVVKNALKHIQHHLLEIKKAARDREVIVLSIPLGTYASESVWQGCKEIGFKTLPEMLNSTKPDEAMQKICAEADIPFLSITESFREKCKTVPLYYKYDGHLNAVGHEVFVDLLLLAIEHYVIKKKSASDRSDSQPLLSPQSWVK